MKKLLTLILLSMVGFGVYAQTNSLYIKSIKKDLAKASKGVNVKKPLYDIHQFKGNEKVPGKKVHYEWIDSNWEFYSKSTIDYYSDGRIKSELLTDLSNNAISRINFTYDASFRITEINSELANGSQWVPYIQSTFAYNSQGDLIKNEDKIWVNTEWVIMQGQQFDVEYDLNNETKSIVESYWNGYKYDSSMKYVSTFDNNVLVLESTYQYDGFGDFIPVEQYEYLYDQSGMDTGMLRQLWDGNNWVDNLLYCEYQWDSPSKEFISSDRIYLKLGSDWKLYQRETFTRDVYGSFSYLSEEYRSGVWYGDMRIVQTNDQYKSRISYVYDLFLNGSWQLLFEIEEEYDYDSEGNVLEHVYKESDSNGELRPLTKDIYSEYFSLTGITKKRTEKLYVYPNPTSDYIRVKDDKLIGKVYTLYNHLGKEIKHDKLDETMSIDVRKIGDGTYILVIDRYSAKVLIKR